MVSSQINVRDALNGSASTHIDKGTEIPLSVRTGVPIIDNGAVIGVISTGYSLTNTEFVDGMKALTDEEFTIFLGDERVNTTIIQNGERVIGTKLDPQIADIVLNKKESYQGNATILGEKFSTGYDPIIDSNGEVIGVLFAGINLTEINSEIFVALINSLIILIILIAVILGIVVSLIKKLVSNPITSMAGGATKIAQGELDISMDVTSDSELGILSDAMGATVKTLNLYIQDISQKLNQMANGDMRVNVELDYIGDFAPIKDALVTIASSLNNTLSTINVASDQVNSGSDQVSSAAQDLATGAAEQASSIEQLSASVIVIANQAEENNKNVGKATEYVRDAGDSMQEGRNQMTELTHAMSDIRTSSNQIAAITKVVEDIAFQTNILALNAAVEAARAGSAGKGFAVVADEVRSLASKSAEAAKQTAELIENSQVSVEHGDKLTKQAEKVIIESVEKSKFAIDSIHEIEVASIAQASAIEEIKQGLNQVSAVVQNNAATAEESSASSEELAAQAQTLKSEVDKFTLEQY